MTEAEYDIARARDDIEAITNAVHQFTIDFAKLPSQEQGFVALLKPPEGVDTSRYPPDGYLAGVLDDPWGNPYQYVTPAQHSEDAFDVFSFGPDGVSNTDDDIGNWN